MTEPTEDPSKENKETGSPQDEWSSALAEQNQQSGQAAPATQADSLRSDDGDDWASALAEQTAAAAAPAAAAGSQVFQPLTNVSSDGDSDIDMIMDIPVQLSVELGRTRLTIKNILQLGQGSVVELEGLAGEPMDIFVNGYLIAQGEVVVVDDKYGIRLTDIITPADRINRLNSKR